jgi:hypothetical protein
MARAKNRRTAPLAPARVLAAGLCLFVVAGCGSGSDPHAVGLLAERSGAEGTNSAPSDLVKAHGTHTYKTASVASRQTGTYQESGPPYPPVKATRRAQIVNGESSPFSTAIIWPVRNGWEASDHRRITGVWAGVAGDDSSVGRFVVLRQNYIRDTQSVDTVDVPGAGALKITHAPLGKGPVQSRAQSGGRFRFNSRQGVTGTLSLTDDAVTVNP